MIQPLKSSKTTWLLYWVDLDEPVPSGNDYFLPTLLIVCDAKGAPLASPEILEELDQVRVENYLLKLFDSLGTPDRLTVCESEDWDDEAWRSFSQENNVEVRFQHFDRRGPEDLRALARTIVLKFVRENAPQPRSKDVARGLLNTAMRVRSSRKKIALLRTALDRDADCSSARIELADAEFQQGNWKSCLAAYDEVIARESPRWQAKSIEWWLQKETRPLLRAIYGRAMTLWHQGRHSEAAVQFERLLRTNPRDNQGVRFFIPLLHLLSENQDAALEYYEEYTRNFPNDYAEPSFLFGWGLALSFKDQETEAKEKYREAMLKNIYVAPMLLEEPEPPRSLWHPNDRAEPAYAGEFIDSYAVLWDREPSALRLLRETWQELLPRITAISVLRERMADYQDQRYEPNYKKVWQGLVEQDEKLTTL